MGPFAAMMIMQGVSTLMKHQGAKAAAAAQRAWKYKRDLAIVARLKVQQSQGRQAWADTNLMRSRNLDIKADASMENRLNELRVASTLKASGIPQGQSTVAVCSQLHATSSVHPTHSFPPPHTPHKSIFPS